MRFLCFIARGCREVRIRLSAPLPGPRHRGTHLAREVERLRLDQAATCGFKPAQNSQVMVSRGRLDLTQSSRLSAAYASLWDVL